MIASGLAGHLQDKKLLNLLKKGLNSPSILTKRGSASGIGFLDSNNKKLRNDGKKLVNRGLGDPTTVVQLISAISLGSLGIFATSNKERKKIINELEKLTKKNDTSIVQGATLSLGVLSKNFDKPKGILTRDIDNRIADPIKLENPIHYLLGISLWGLGTNQNLITIERIQQMLSRITNKTARRSAALCLAYLISSLDIKDMLNQLDVLINSNIEYQSKAGSDTAIVLCYLNLLSDKSSLEKLMVKAKNWATVDSDYNEIYEIIKSKPNYEKTLAKLMDSSDLDLRVAAINACYGTPNLESIKTINKFYFDSLKNNHQSFYDILLLMTQILTYAIKTKQYDLSEQILEFLTSADSRVKKIASMTYACLKGLKGDLSQIYSKFRMEKDHDLKWGYLVGLGLIEKISTMESLSGEYYDLLIGYIMLGIGSTDNAIPMLFSFMINQNKRE